jgi:hypothetical protein
MGFKETMFGKDAVIPPPPDPLGFQGATGSMAWTPQGYQYTGPEVSPAEAARQRQMVDLSRRMQIDPSFSSRLAGTQAAADQAMSGLLAYRNKQAPVTGVGKGRVYEDVMRKIAARRANADIGRSIAAQGIGMDEFSQGQQRQAGLLQYAKGQQQQDLANRLLFERASLSPAKAATDYQLRDYQQQVIDAQKEASGGMFGGLASLAGTAIGTMIGGPAGGKIGQQIGASVAGPISRQFR